MEIYGVNLRIESEYRKIRTRKKLCIFTLFTQDCSSGNAFSLFVWRQGEGSGTKSDNEGEESQK